MMLVMMLWYYDNGSPREYKIYNKSNTAQAAAGRVGRLSPNNFLSPLPSVFAFWGLAGSPQ